MATITNAQTTASAVGIVEGINEQIGRVDVEETPIMSMIGEGQAKQPLYEWQTRLLGTVNTSNAAPEGDTTTNAASTQNVRISNICQISKKNATVSGTMDATELHGRESEMALQMADRTIELRKDMEAIQFGTNQAYSNGGTRTLRSLEAWIRTNTVKGASGADPADPTVTPGTTRTDGTIVNFTAAMIDTIMQACFLIGARPSKIVMGATAKVKFSTFTGRTGSYIDISKAVVTNNVTKYESNFGVLDAVPHPYIRQRTVFLLDPKYIKTVYLRKFKSYPLAKVGDATTREILSEYTLQVLNERAHGIIADIQ
jgi:hypothetical protein